MTGSSSFARRSHAWTAMLLLAFGGCGADSGPTGHDAVASVTVAPPSVTIAVGATTTLTATVKDASGNTLEGRPVVWSSGSPTILAVSAEGVVTARAPGSAIVAANVLGRSGVASVTVVTAGIVSLSVEPRMAEVLVGGSVPLQAIALDAQGQPITGRTVSWSSTNTAVASVNGAGLVSGITPGATTITAAVDGKTATAAIAVSAIPVASISLSQATASIVVGQSTQLTATPRDTAGNPLPDRIIAWTSSNNTVSSVSSSGLVLGLTPGSATITASTGGRSATASISVTPVPASAVTVSPSSLTLIAGRTDQLTAQVTDANGNVLPGRPISWSSENTAVATVSPSGAVSAITPGTATIRASSDGRSGTAIVTVIPVPVASVTVVPGSVDLFVGQTRQLSAVARDANGNILSGRVATWSSSAPGVASVAPDGGVSALSPGGAVVTANVEGQTGSATITVRPVPVASVSVTPTSATIFPGQTVPLTATPRDESGNPLTDRAVSWSTSDGAVAIVSATGVVAALSPGIVTITATVEGKSASAIVTVRPIPVARVAITPPIVTVPANRTTTVTATTYDASNNVLTGRAVAWSSSNTSVATVSASGVVAGVVQGSAIITATSEGISGSAPVTVTPPPVASIVIAPAVSTVQVARDVSLGVTLRDDNGVVLTGRVLTWSSSNTSVATVSPAGVVRGVASGEVTITAMSEGISGTAKVSVVLLP